MELDQPSAERHERLPVVHGEAKSGCRIGPFGHDGKDDAQDGPHSPDQTASAAPPPERTDAIGQRVRTDETPTPCGCGAHTELSDRLVAVNRAQAIPELRMAPHVRACVCKEQVVLLDLRRSRYLSIGARGTGAMSQRVVGWPSLDAAQALGGDQVSPAAIDAAMRRLMELELLTSALADGAAAPALEGHPPTSLPPARRGLESDDDVSLPEVRAVDALRFLRSSVQAHWWLRRYSLESIAKRVDFRRAAIGARRALGTRISGADLERSPATDASPRRADVEASTLRAAALTFERLRPFAFTARDRCLRDSLALMGFLSPLGLNAHWVIGVRTRPFGAHSWVQYGDLVLNDHHEHVRAYQPILIV